MGQNLWGLSSKEKAHPSIMTVSGPTRVSGSGQQHNNSQPYSQISFHSEATESPCRDNSIGKDKVILRDVRAISCVA